MPIVAHSAGERTLRNQAADSESIERDPIAPVALSPGSGLPSHGGDRQFMLFTSYAFPVFVFGALCAYYAVGRITRNHGPQNLTLVLSGYLFYALWDWRWCGLLALVTLSGWLGGRLLTRGCIHARLVVAAVAVSNLAVLGCSVLPVFCGLLAYTAHQRGPPRRWDHAGAGSSRWCQLLRVPEPLLRIRRVPWSHHARFGTAELQHRIELLPPASGRPDHAASCAPPAARRAS